MFALLLMFVGNFFVETSTALGKKAMAKRTETIYGYAFLNVFWVTLFLIIFVLLGANFHFSRASLPFFIPRMIVEIIMAQIAALAIHKADLSTFSFIRLTTIPILLIIDVILGYSIKPVQMVGIILIFGALVYLLSKNNINRRGSKLVIAVALLAPINISLLKYDITHYNSIAAEQILICLGILSYFTIAAWLHTGEKTWSYLYRARTEIQSISQGLGSSIGVFAYAYVPASIAVTFSRSTELLLAILFGNVAFHERRIGRKLGGFVVVLAALILIAMRA